MVPAWRICWASARSRSIRFFVAGWVLKRAWASLAEKGEMMKATIPADLNGTEQLSIKISCLKKPGTQMGIDEIAFIP